MLSLLLTLHWSSQQSHLHLPTNHIWNCVHCGCCPWFGQNPDCDPGIQGQETGKNQEVVTGGSNDVIPLCFLIQVILCGVWQGTSSPFLELYTRSEPKELIIVCKKDLVIDFYSVLGYLGSLALGTFSLAFLTRNLPDTFNEAKFLTFSMQCLGCLPPCLAPRARLWWPWRSCPCWPPVRAPRLHLCPRVLHDLPKT